MKKLASLLTINGPVPTYGLYRSKNLNKAANSVTATTKNEFGCSLIKT